MRMHPAAYGEAQNRVITHKPPPSGLKEGVVFFVFRGCCGWGGLALFCRKRLEQAGLAEGLHGGDFCFGSLICGNKLF